mmetsp:Transcript_24389/g.39315  ORF Transcript_24389/g.39315 Transcript_24389/m.39315 type:complete len:405 (-) Transcript_24389:159-1373(-)
MPEWQLPWLTVAAVLAAGSNLEPALTQPEDCMKLKGQLMTNEIMGLPQFRDHESRHETLNVNPKRLLSLHEMAKMDFQKRRPRNFLISRLGRLKGGKRRLEARASADEKKETKGHMIHIVKENPETEWEGDTLQYRWTCWGFSKDTRTSNWEDLFDNLWTCSDKPTFSFYLHAMKPPSSLAEGCDLYFFKEGITPAWEDPANAMGGRWTVTLGSKEFENLDESAVDFYWESLLSALVSGDFDDYGEICGVVLNNKRNLRRISVWIRHASREFEELIISIGVQIKDLMGLPLGKELAFQSHDQRLIIPESLRHPWKEVPPAPPPPMQHHSDGGGGRTHQRHHHTGERGGSSRAWKDGSKSVGRGHDVMTPRFSLSKGPRPPYTVSRRGNSDKHGNGGGSNKGRGR